jgi:hypothetical protein
MKWWVKDAWGLLKLYLGPFGFNSTLEVIKRLCNSKYSYKFKWLKRSDSTC